MLYHDPRAHSAYSKSHQTLLEVHVRNRLRFLGKIPPATPCTRLGPHATICGHDLQNVRGTHGKQRRLATGANSWLGVLLEQTRVDQEITKMVLPVESRDFML